jgi:hypothetical protein
MEGTILSVAYTAGLFDVSRAFVSSELPERASADQDGMDSPDGLRAFFREKTKNRGRGWAK